MKLVVTQKPENGFLGGPKELTFSMRYGNADYELSIEQCIQRTITIASEGMVSYSDLLEVYYSLETLLMLFDGQFYPVVSAFEDDIEITQSWKKRALPSYSSADFMQGAGNVLINFESVVNADRLMKWISLREELDIIHNMVLYCFSSVQIPKDVQCAFVIEAFKGMSTIIEKERPNVKFQKDRYGHAYLKSALLYFLNEYGQSIFAEETNRNLDEFAQILANSRNRIAHIKSEQDTDYLDESLHLLYLMKLSLLYRIVILDLLGVSSEINEDCLIKRVQWINEHDAIANFLQKLGEL